MADSLRSHLLIASPRLEDYFRRTVVLVLEHNEDGAMGVVLNRPSDAPVAEAVPPCSNAEPIARGRMRRGWEISATARGTRWKSGRHVVLFRVCGRFWSRRSKCQPRRLPQLKARSMI